MIDIIDMVIAGQVAADTIDSVAQGPSAYDIAVKNGFEGTEAEWLASLKGEQGEPGKTISWINVTE